MNKTAAIKTDTKFSNTGADNTPLKSSSAFIPPPLPAGLLKKLLDRLEISVQAGALNKACRDSQTAIKGASPIQYVDFIFNTLQIKNVKATQLHWSRFDQRRLPALMFTEKKWRLVEHSQNGLLSLTDDEGNSLERNKEMIEEGFVLWLHTKPKREKFSSLSFGDNIAAQLVLHELFRSRHWLINVVIATLIINILAVSTSLFAMQVYDRVVPTLAYATLWTLVVGMSIIVMLDWLLKTLRARILDSVSCAVDKALSQKVFDHVMRLQLDIRPRSLGTLAAQVSGLDSVKQFFTSGVIFALVDLPFALMFIAFIALIGGSIAWVYLIMLPVAATLGWLTQRRLRQLMKEQLIRSNERQGLLVDAIKGSESIRANNATWRFSEQWKEVTATISGYNIQQKAISNFAVVTTGSLSTTAYVSALVVGVGQIESGSLTMGALIACSILGGRVIAPVAQSVQYLSQWQNVSQALQMVNQLLILNTERRPEQNLLMPDEPPDKIGLKGVCFSYPDSPIRQLNIPKLNFKAGDRVAILGSVGSGKSTLLKVLAGLYYPSEGRVRLGNADLWELDPTVVTNNIGYLPQSVHLFKGTLHSNLTLSGAVSDSFLLQIIAELGIDRIAEDNPRSIELPISEGGEGLSDGQRQLVGLGRVFLARPKIWILDEPTASLDNESENQVLQAIQNHVKPSDILLISTHRPALATKLSNRVIVIQRGEVTADGKPELVIPRMMKNYSGKRENITGDNHVKMLRPEGVNINTTTKGPFNVI